MEHEHGPPLRKSVLFCPDCGHESPPDGDWEHEAGPAGCVLTCPECGHVVVDRPRLDPVPA